MIVICMRYLISNVCRRIFYTKTFYTCVYQEIAMSTRKVLRSKDKHMVAKVAQHFQIFFQIRR